MDFVISYILIIVMAYLFVYITNKLKLPTEVSLLIFGLFLAFPGLSQIFIGSNHDLFLGLGIFGLFSLMFLAGLNSSSKQLKREETDSIIIAGFSTIIPFILGYMVFQILGFSIVESLVVGICMTITAEGTKAQLLLELNKIRSKLGSVMLSAGLIDDFFGLFIFSFVLLFMGVVDFSEQLILIGILFFFFLGNLVRNYARHHHLTKKAKVFLNIFLVPMFFVSMGMYFDYSLLVVSNVVLIVLILIAIIGKIFSVMLCKPFVEFSYKQLHILGWAMNSRGAIELAIAIVALNAGLIGVELYSSIVLMALLTTLIFPFILEYSIKKNPKIMD